MMKRYRVLALVCLAALLAACSTILGDQIVGSGKVITEERPVGRFTSIELSCSADVALAQGDQILVSIEGEDNIIPLIETKVSGFTLHIDVKPNTSYSHTKPLVVHITAPVITSVKTTGSGDVEMDQWVVDSLDLAITGSGNIHIGKLDAPAITAEVSGSGDISIAGGEGGKQNITTTGSGDFDARSLESLEVTAKATGSGDITVWVTRSLSATTSGSGDIRYFGSPQVNQKTTGSGNVEKLGDEP